MDLPNRQDPFRAHLDTFSQKVRQSLTPQDIDEIFAPRVPDEVTQAFFPGFATFRHPNVAAQTFTRFGKLPTPWRDSWHTRLYLNTLTAIALYDASLRNVLTTTGPVAENEQGSEIIGNALGREWRFGLWSYAQAAAAPLKTFFCFDLLVLGCCFVIETVESRVDERPGGWRLVEEVLHVLDAHGTEWNIPWIHTLATNPDAVSVFRHYGFVDADTEEKVLSPRATPLRRAVRPPTREFGSPPPDLQHLFSEPM